MVRFRTFLSYFHKLAKKVITFLFSSGTVFILIKDANNNIIIMLLALFSIS